MGENEVWEKDKDVLTIENLGFAGCKLSLAIPKDENYTGPSFFENKKVATSYPKILQKFFTENNINAEIEEIGGSVEIAPGIGLADGIFDIVVTVVMNVPMDDNFFDVNLLHNFKDTIPLFEFGIGK